MTIDDGPKDDYGGDLSSKLLRLLRLPFLITDFSQSDGRRFSLCSN